MLDIVFSVCVSEATLIGGWGGLTLFRMIWASMGMGGIKCHFKFSTFRVGGGAFTLNFFFFFVCVNI